MIESGTHQAGYDALIVATLRQMPIAQAGGDPAKVTPEHIRRAFELHGIPIPDDLNPLQEC